MPIYEYDCQQCRQKVTIRHGMDDTLPQRCPICGSMKLTRIISRFSIAKSGTDRIKDLSWIDKDLSRRLRKKASRELSPGLRETLDRLESG
ncbi:MAG: zinc ribbon domain-containing protein [Sedimentisphaerales bacterium]|nr:zinc ribbon domain-containing protein [Sedimentisphaerales bacterium]